VDPSAALQEAQENGNTDIVELLMADKRVQSLF